MINCFLCNWKSNNDDKLYDFNNEYIKAIKYKVQSFVFFQIIMKEELINFFIP